MWLIRARAAVVAIKPHKHTPFCFTHSCSKFEEWLKSLDPDYGLRNLEDVVQVAESSDLELLERIEMPANNLSVLFRRRRNTNVEP